MQENNFRKALIKLAHENPELRQHLVPLLRKDADLLDKLKGLLFRNPATGNRVHFESLPPEEQKKIRERETNSQLQNFKSLKNPEKQKSKTPEVQKHEDYAAWDANRKLKDFKSLKS